MHWCVETPYIQNSFDKNDTILSIYAHLFTLEFAKMECYTNMLLYGLLKNHIWNMISLFKARYMLRIIRIKKKNIWNYGCT